jgi:Subtilase family/PatG C-terminal
MSFGFGVFGTGAESLLRPPIHRSTAVQGLSPAHAVYFRRQGRGINLQPAGLPVAVIDGPFDAAALSKILARTPVSFANGGCRTDTNGACSHGTFVMGLIGASRDASIPGLCPECQLLHVQLFVDEGTPNASIARLADAITVAVGAGAKLINLSLAIQGEDAAGDCALARALDRAEARDAVIMVAAGNEGRRASGQLLSHPVAIPVVAVDATHQLLPDCNFGPTISARGIAAIGHQVPGYAPGGGAAVMSGTSVATAVATGTLAQLWSERPLATGKQVRGAVAGLTPRDGSLPPMLDRDSFLAELDRRIAAGAAPTSPTLHGETNDMRLQGETTMIVGNGLPRTGATGPVATSAQPVTPANGPGCACGAPGGTCTCADAGPSHFVYVLGTVDVRPPDQSISGAFQELAEAMVNGGQGPAEELRDWCYRILTVEPRKNTRYVARQFCWILFVEGQPAYYLILRDMQDLDILIDSLGQPKNQDLCLVVGSSSLQLVELCPGIRAPVLAVDGLCWLDKGEILGRFEASTRLGVPGADELYKELFQSADNFGHTDEWRALNWLAVRYPPIYRRCADMVRDGYDLKGFPVLTSRLADWGTKRVVDAVFTFGKAGDIKKFFVRVDVTYLFPMLVSHVAKYVDRVNV